MMYKLIAIIGPAGSGKDTALWALKKTKIKNKINFVVNCTTRPQRENEVAIENYSDEGPGYKFLEPPEMWKKMNENQMIEVTTFNNWVYGTEIAALDKEKVNIGVFNPHSLEMILDNDELDVRVVKLSVTDRTRLIRQLSRELDPDIEEIIRRYQADEKLFKTVDLKRVYILSNENKKDLVHFKRFITSVVEHWDEVD